MQFYVLKHTAKLNEISMVVVVNDVSHTAHCCPAFLLFANDCFFFKIELNLTSQPFSYAL